MISSMTGYGRGEVTEGRTTVMAEIRAVNSRYLEIATRLPRTLSLRENGIKELIRTKFSRGKVNIAVNIVHENATEVPMKINASTAHAYYKLLTDLRKSLKIQGKIGLEHLLQFPDILEVDEFAQGDENEWTLAKRAVTLALDQAARMRQEEGGELLKDFIQRITVIEKTLGEVETLAQQRIPEERADLQERVKALLTDPSIIDEKRLEMEFALLLDKLDVTEECVRFRSHNKFFLEALKNGESVGRKLNFLLQEMNREANTIGSKSNSSEIAHRVVAIKEDLEKIREQVQNIE